MNDDYNNLTPEQTAVSQRIFNLVLGRVLAKIYKELDKKGQKEMDEVTSSGDDEVKDKFIKKYIPDFQNVFKKELVKVSEEILEELKK